MTVSEIAVTILIWSLTLIGGFFSLRSALRKRRNRKTKKH